MFLAKGGNWNIIKYMHIKYALRRLVVLYVCASELYVFDSVKRKNVLNKTWDTRENE